MIKRQFIRVLYGIYDNSHRLIERRSKIDIDIDTIKNNKFNTPFKVYIFGDDNYNKLKDKFDCVLVDKNPAPFDLVKHQYRNKMELIRIAMGDYDEIVYMDWDCVPQKLLSSNFWEECNKKEVFQACLIMYHRRKCPWRATELRKVPNGGFIYMRDKTVIDKAIKLWEANPIDNDEPSFARLTDDMMGGWSGQEKYWELFETNYCNIHKASPYSNELLKSKDICFMHYQGQ